MFAPSAPVSRLPRTQSSVLAFQLREFLNTPTEYHTVAAPSRMSTGDVSPRSSSVQQPPVHPQPRSSSWQPDGTVWVDCYFYGFWLDKSKANLFRSSLQSTGA